ncbi:uncharacterized protein [Musca autumnalis]|uniref:uncharacterized protein n=1 Tax=Musca autumnalis TaxID=221902 RepID=UPI003CED068B
MLMLGNWKTGDKREIGLYGSPLLASMTGFSSGTTLTTFQASDTKLYITLLAFGLAIAVVSAQSNAIDATVEEPSQEYLPPAEEADAAKLAEDGYRYKTVRKLKFRARHRRDVSQEYLPPANEPSVEYLPPADAADTKVADDGYRYKTVRTLKFRSRHRRDVSQEYLPPVNEPSVEYLPPVEAADTKVADDGYRYKTVRKLKLRHRQRRDVSEIEQPSGEYLPPVEVELAPELKTILGDDGYRYKTVKRFKVRRHRREAESDAAAADNTSAAYLPPAEEMTADADMAAEAKTAELAEDGYRYKTLRKLKYRRRH